MTKDYSIRTQCPFCKEYHDIPATSKQIQDFQYSDKKVQEIFPELSCTEREMLISGCCPDCWDKYML